MNKAERLNKDIGDLNNTVNKPNLSENYRTLATVTILTS